MQVKQTFLEPSHQGAIEVKITASMRVNTNFSQVERKSVQTGDFSLIFLFVFWLGGVCVSVSLCVCVCGFILACGDLGRMFDHSFETCAFFFFFFFFLSGN